MSNSSEYVVVWSGRGPLPGMTGEGFSYRGSYLTEAGEGNAAASGLPSSKELRGKGVAYNRAELRNYQPDASKDRACACGKGIPHARWGEGAVQCYRCAAKALKVRTRDILVSQAMKLQQAG